jgi:hypothetical protein
MPADREREITCGECGCRDVGTRIEAQDVPYGIGEQQVVLSATVPVRECRGCGFAFTDEEGEDARDAAVQAHVDRKSTCEREIQKRARAAAERIAKSWVPLVDPSRSTAVGAITRVIAEEMAVLLLLEGK